MIGQTELEDAAYRVATLCQEYGISAAQLQQIVEEQATTSVPASLFATELTPLEAIVRHLRTQGLRQHEIAALTGRDPRAISTTLRRNATTSEAPEAMTNSTYRFPVSLLKDRRLSPFEHLITHLQARYHLRLREIAAITQRDERTIGTIARRAQAKLAEAS